MSKLQLSGTTVRQLIDYFPRTGLLRWKKRSVDWFKSQAQADSWNARYAGKPAFTYRANGHFAGAIVGQHQLAHRVAFLFMRGRWPKAIAFKNGDGFDCRWVNLIERKSAADARDYTRHQLGRLDSKGYQTPSGSWVARLGTEYLGVYPDEQTARTHRNKAAGRRWG